MTTQQTPPQIKRTGEFSVSFTWQDLDHDAIFDIQKAVEKRLSSELSAGIFERVNDNRAYFIMVDSFQVMPDRSMPAFLKTKIGSKRAMIFLLIPSEALEGETYGVPRELQGYKSWPYGEADKPDGRFGNFDLYVRHVGPRDVGPIGS